MSRPTRRAKDLVQEPSPPVPPSDGWTLMEAAYALCPREAELYRQDGAAIEAAVLHDMRRSVKRIRPPGYYYYERWLSIDWSGLFATDRTCSSPGAICRRGRTHHGSDSRVTSFFSPRRRRAATIPSSIAVCCSSSSTWMSSNHLRVSGYYDLEEDERYPIPQRPLS